MKKNEWITLGIGLLVIICIAFGSGMFSNSKVIKSMNQSTSKVPEVIAKNISTDPKVQILEVAVGNGTSTATTNKTVSVNYTGMLEDGTVFDSSYTRGVPIEFVLGIGKVIKGWDLGLQGMKVGGKRRLIISPEYAYGTQGVPGAIPANATLIFDLELVGIK
jgi:peptidylprolyl isomerase